MSRLNLPHGTTTKKCKTEKLKSTWYFGTTNPRPKRHFDRFSCFSTAHQQTDRRIDRQRDRQSEREREIERERDRQTDIVQ